MRFLSILVSVFVFVTTQDTSEKCKAVTWNMVCQDVTEQDLPKTAYPNVTTLTILKSNVGTIKASMFKNLPKLANFHADGVGIEKIEDDAFKSTGHLDWIDLARNKIKAISPDLVESLNMIHLNISHNRGLAIPERKPFLKNDKLQWLHMQNCEITNVYSETFRLLPGLFHLTLAHNQLKTLPEDILQNNRRIMTLDLTGNQIKVLNPRVFANIFIIVVGFEDNPWVCDCNLTPLLKWSKKNVVQGVVKCAQPAGKKWKDITELTPCPKNMK